MSWWKKLFGQTPSDDTNPNQSPGFNQPNNSNKNMAQLPAFFELIPGKLRVRVYQHEIDTCNGAIPCWSYVSDGLWKHGQKELIFTLHSSDSDELTASPDIPSQSDYGVHQYIFAFYKEVYRFAQQGQMVYEGDCTQFGSQGFLGCGNWSAFVYTRPQPLEGIEVTSPLLAAILLTAEEFEVYQNFGLTRVLSHLGRAYVYYPCPPWTERSRSSVVSMKEMQGTILGRMPLLSVRGGGARVYQEARPHSIQQSPQPRQFLQQQIVQWSENSARITLRLLPQAGEQLRRQLVQCPPDSIVALLTELDPTANACLVWRSGQADAFAITPPNSEGSRSGGCFIAFVPQQDADRGQVLEDGFVMLLTDQSWLTIRDAIALGNPIFIPATNNGASFSLEWIPQTYQNPIDGMSYTVEEGWNQYLPTSPRVEADGEPARIQEIILLTNENDLAVRIGTEALANYIRDIENTVKDCFVSLSWEAGQDLLLEFEIHPRSKIDLKVASQPGIDPKIIEGIYNSLLNLPVPHVNGAAIQFQVIVNIWGGFSDRVARFQ